MSELDAPEAANGKANVAGSAIGMFASCCEPLMGVWKDGDWQTRLGLLLLPVLVLVWALIALAWRHWGGIIAETFASDSKGGLSSHLNPQDEGDGSPALPSHTAATVKKTN